MVVPPLTECYPQVGISLYPLQWLHFYCKLTLVVILLSQYHMFCFCSVQGQPVSLTSFRQSHYQFLKISLPCRQHILMSIFSKDSRKIRSEYTLNSVEDNTAHPCTVLFLANYLSISCFNTKTLSIYEWERPARKPLCSSISNISLSMLLFIIFPYNFPIKPNTLMARRGNSKIIVIIFYIYQINLCLETDSYPKM